MTTIAIEIEKRIRRMVNNPTFLGCVTEETAATLLQLAPTIDLSPENYTLDEQIYIVECWDEYVSLFDVNDELK